MSGEWTISNFVEEDGEILYFFKGDYGREAWIVMYPDGSIHFKGTKEILIRKAGSVNEKIVVRQIQCGSKTVTI